MKVIGYARLSKGEGGDLGLEAQKAAILAECERRDWELVGEVREEIKSGAKAANRPVLQEVLAALRRREADAVVVAKLDRLSRSVVDAGREAEDHAPPPSGLVATRDRGAAQPGRHTCGGATLVQGHDHPGAASRVMASKRIDGPTPNGGAYVLAVYMDLDRWVEVEEDKANGMIVTEYDSDGNILLESVAHLERSS